MRIFWELMYLFCCFRFNSSNPKIMAKVMQVIVIRRDNCACTVESSISPDRFDVEYIHSGAIYIHNKLIIIIVGVSLTGVELVELYFSTIIW